VPATGDVDLEAFRAEAHRFVDWMTRYLAENERLPVLSRARPGEVRSALPAVPPTRAEPLGDFLADVERVIVPGITHWNHPSFFAYFANSATAPGILGEILSAAFNSNAMLWKTSPAATELELVVLDWLRQMLGLPEGLFGVIQDTASTSTLVALAAAREAVPGLDARRRGLVGQARLRMYASEHAHSSVEKAGIVLGIGQDGFRAIPADDAFRMDAAALARAIAEDRAAGFTPFAVTATAGTTSTTSIDPIPAIADVCERERLWLHVDAAYGGGARLSKRDAGRVADLDCADSVTIDPHKWFFQTCDIGGLLVKRREDLPATFHREPEYYRSSEPESEPLHWYQYSIEGTRRFRALKLWLSWKHLGTEGLGRFIEANDDLAAYLARRCREADDLETVPPVPELSVVCFRHLPGGRAAASALDPQVLDRYQDRLQRALEVSGEGWVSTTRLRGRTYLRAGVVNYLSTEKDVDQILDALRRLSPGALREATL